MNEFDVTLRSRWEFPARTYLDCCAGEEAIIWAKNAVCVFGGLVEDMRGEHVLRGAVSSNKSVMCASFFTYVNSSRSSDACK